MFLWCFSNQNRSVIFCFCQRNPYLCTEKYWCKEQIRFVWYKHCAQKLGGLTRTCTQKAFTQGCSCTRTKQDLHTNFNPIFIAGVNMYFSILFTSVLINSLQTTLCTPVDKHFGLGSILYYFSLIILFNVLLDMPKTYVL